MAQTGYTPIQLYRTATPAAAPAAVDLLAGELAINTADGKLFYKDASNNVQVIATKDAAAGIFTSITDSGNLTFTGTGNRITGDFSNATLANRVMVQTSTVNGNTGVSAIPNGTGSVSIFATYNNSDPTNAAGIQIRASSTEGQLASYITGTGTYLPMTFYTGGSERVRIDTSGNVGIGTTAPNSRLTVQQAASDAAVGSSFRGYTTATADGQRTFITQYVDSSNSYFANHRSQATTHQFYVNNAEVARIDSSGHVGIGITPINKLDVNGRGRFVQDAAATTGAIILRQNSGDTVGAHIQWVTNDNISQKGHMLVDTSSNMIFATGSTERMRITSGGDLLVGTTSNAFGAKTVSVVVSSPAFAARFSGAGGAGTGFNSIYDDTTGTAYGAVFYYNGTANQPGAITYTSTTTTYNTSSDYRLKNIEGALINSGSYIDSLRPVHGTWKTDGSRFIGLIAHEVQEVSQTKVATGEKDAVDADGNPVYQGMDYSSAEIIANLIAEVQSLRKRVAQLEGA